MTITFQPNELERKAKEYFEEEYDFYWDDERRMTIESFFENNEYLFGVDSRNFSQKQKNIIYKAYLKAFNDYIMIACKEELKKVLEKYNCELNETCEGYITIYNNDTKEEIEF